MPLLVQVLLVWVALSALVGPLVGMVLAPASRTTAQAPAQAPPPTRVRARWLRPVAA